MSVWDLANEVIVKNTFLEFSDGVDSERESGTGCMRRSFSESDLMSTLSYQSGSKNYLGSNTSHDDDSRRASKRSCTSNPGSDYENGSYTSERFSGNSPRSYSEANDYQSDSSMGGTGIPWPDSKGSRGGFDMKEERFLTFMLHQETGEPLHILENLAKQGLLSQIPRNEYAQITTVGSILHNADGATEDSEEKCKPCIFWFRDKCKKGIRCQHCHFTHPGQKSKRLRASRTTRQRSAMEQQYLEQHSQDVQEESDMNAPSEPPKNTIISL